MADNMSIKIVHSNGSQYIGAAESFRIFKEHGEIKYEIDGAVFDHTELQYLKVENIEYVKKEG